MKKRSIRLRMFAWLAVYTVCSSIMLALAIICFDLYEYLENPANLADEVEEMLVVVMVMAVFIPLSLGGAWRLTRRLLHPWRTLVLQAERIGGGELEERIEVRNPRDEIGRLAMTLNQAFDRYRHLLDRLERFNYDASHQLRNPLAAIRANGEICLKHERSEAEYRAAIEGMLEDAGRLQRTVEQLLLLARTSGDIQECRRITNLHELIGEVVREGRVIGELRNIAVEFKAPGEPIHIEAIPDLLREAVSNLMDNALKYSPDDSVIVVGLSLLANGYVRIEVRDSGAGLSPEMKANLFKPFSKGGNPSKESTGLGLAIMADICRAHSGRFGVETPEAGGSCFWIELLRRSET